MIAFSSFLKSKKRQLRQGRVFKICSLFVKRKKSESDAMDLDWLLLSNLLQKQKLYVHISPTYISNNVFASSFYGFHVSILVRYRVSEYPRNRKVILRK